MKKITILLLFIVFLGGINASAQKRQIKNKGNFKEFSPISIYGGAGYSFAQSFYQKFGETEGLKIPSFQNSGFNAFLGLRKVWTEIPIGVSIEASYAQNKNNFSVNVLETDINNDYTSKQYGGVLKGIFPLTNFMAITLPFGLFQNQISNLNHKIDAEYTDRRQIFYTYAVKKKSFMSYSIGLGLDFCNTQTYNGLVFSLNALYSAPIGISSIQELDIVYSNGTTSSKQAFFKDTGKNFTINLTATYSFSFAKRKPKFTN
jgi:hypothetical protein